MQFSHSLADFMAKLEEGPQGPDDAAAAIDKCARESSPLLDLQQMHLTDEDMRAISPKFASIASHVKILNLFMNEISILPQSISALTNLEVLQAGCNPLHQVDSALLKHLPKLRELDVGFSELLEELPDSFDSCSSLRIVLAGNGRLKHIPESLFRCERLEELHLYGNDLKEIDEKIGNLRGLRVFNIGRNQVAQIPESISQCAALQTLHAYENCLTTLPVGLAELRNLETLNVASNSGMPVPPREVRCQPNVGAVAAFYAA